MGIFLMFPFSSYISILFYFSLSGIRSTQDPEGLFGKPQTGHIARNEFKRRLEKDAEAREAFERHVREEKERRKTLREVILATGVFEFDGCFHFKFLLLACVLSY